MKIKTQIIKLALVGLLAPLFVPLTAQAVALTARSITLQSSAASASTNYVFSFKPGTSGNIGTIKFEVCDSPVETVGCVNTGNSSGASLAGASLQSQSGISSFQVGAGTPPAPSTHTFWIYNNTPQNINSSTVVSVTLSSVINPSAANKQFYGRMTTYSDSAGSVEVDYGAVSVSTANQMVVSGVMPESLIFCVGTSGTDCGNITGSAASLGVFSPLNTNVATSVMSASTNAGSGYVITMTGTTLTSGSNTIPAMGDQSLNSTGCTNSCSSSAGSSQFGTNVRANNLASAGGNFGADVTGLGTGSAMNGYAVANSFRFFAGDTVAAVGGVSKDNLYTNSYMVNVGGDQPAGVYTSTLTYICTASF